MPEVVEWRPLDSDKLNQPSSEDVGGIQIKSYASPYDVPEAMRVHMYPNTCYLLIEFKYMGGEEEVEPEIKDDHLKFWLGRNSRRLCKAEFDLRQYEPDAMIRALDQLSGERQRPPRESNYQITKNVLLSYLRSLDYSKCKPLKPLTGPAE